MFEMDLSRTLTNNDEVGLLKISTNKELNIIEQLKENKLLNLSKLSRELTIEKGEIVEYFAFIPKISINSFEALISALNDYCSKIKTDEYDIILTKAHSTNDGADVSELIKILAEG